HPLRALLGDLVRLGARRLRPEPLSAQAVAELARRHGRNAAGLHEATGGNPFFVTEALSAGVAGLPETARDAGGRAPRRLAPAAREALQVVAVVPGRAEAWLLDELAVPAAGLDEATEHGMLVAERDALAFRHELARRAVEETVPPLRRLRLHAAILAAL